MEETQQAAVEETPPKTLNEIEKICTVAGLDETYARSLQHEGLTLEQARKRVINEIAHKPEEQIDHRFEPGDGVRSRDFASVCAEGLLHRERMQTSTNREALALSDTPFVDIAKRCAEMDGVHLQTTNRREIARRAFNDSTTLQNVAAVLSTRSLTSGYEAQPRTFIGAFRESSASNFKENQRIHMSDAPKLPVVGEGAQFPEVALSDRKETYQVEKFGEIIAFTWEMMVNDDLSALTRIPEMLGNAASVTESDTFWAIINGNAPMSDTVPVFDASKNNLVTGTPLTADALEDAREQLRSVVTENGVKLHLIPRYLFVGADLERAAEKLISPPSSHSESDITAALSASYARSLELRVEPRINAGEWYVVCDYRQLDTLEYAWLASKPGPFIETEKDFSTSGLRIKVTDVFGAGVIDRLALYKGTTA